MLWKKAMKPELTIHFTSNQTPMSKINLSIIIMLALLAGSCSQSSKEEVIPTPTPPPEMYFRGGMDSVTITPNISTPSNLVFNGWNSLKNNPLVDNFIINNSGSKDYAYQEIVNNPTTASEKVMHAVLLNDDPNDGGTTRAQTSLYFNEGVFLDVYHSSLRMMLHNDVKVLFDYPGKVSWFDIFESWTAVVPAWGGNVAGSARWNLQIFKDAGTTKFYWVAAAETMEPTRTTIWTEQNRLVPIPVNKWFTLDAYIKQGDGNKGKYIIKITVDGEQTQTLFDISNSTIYPGHPEIQRKSWQAFKFYFDPDYLAWISTNGGGKKLQCYYNDFIWYKE